MSLRKILLIVWWSRTGASKALAEACHEAAQAEFLACSAAPDRAQGILLSSFEVRIRRCDEVAATDLLEASALIFACPENLASMAGMMKEFFDTNYYPALGQLNGRAYATMISAGSDGSGAARQIERIATGWRLRKVAEPLICNVQVQEPEAILAPKHLDETQLAPARALGQAFAAALVMGVY